MARPRKGSEPNWGAIKVFYLNDHSAKECAFKFGLSSRSIEMRATKEGWRSQLNQNVEEAQAKLRTADALTRQAERIDDLGDLGDQLKDELAADKSSIRNKIECYAKLADAHDKIIRTRRLVAGLRDGDPSSHQEETEERGKVYVVAIDQKTA